MTLRDGKSSSLCLGDVPDCVIENEERRHGHRRYGERERDARCSRRVKGKEERGIIEKHFRLAEERTHFLRFPGFTSRPCDIGVVSE